MEVKVTSGRFTRVEADATKGVLYMTIENNDPQHVGITSCTLRINCGSPVAAADWLSHFYRDLDFDLVLRTKG